MKRILILAGVATMLSACAYDAREAAQCDKISDWSERKVCQQKAQRSQQDWNRDQSAEKTR